MKSTGMKPEHILLVALLEIFFTQKTISERYSFQKCKSLCSSFLIELLAAILACELIFLHVLSSFFFLHIALRITIYF